MGVISCGTTMLDQGVFENIGAVTWDTTPKTTTFSAVNGNGYFVNTTAGVVTVNLPAGVAGNIVSMSDYAATWQTNNVTVTPNGSEKIGSINASVTLNTEGQSVTLVYVDSTQGWINTMDSTSNVRGNPYIVATGGTITCCGDYKTHTFTGPGTFAVTTAAISAPNNVVDYLVIAGGGGAAGDRAGGAGAGGFRVSNSLGCIPAPTMSPLVNPSGLTVSATSFPIIVGSGGGGAPGPSVGTNGGVSTFSTITSAGGGASKPNCVGGGSSGGSGSGAHGPGTGAAGNTPPVSPPQGNNGGNAVGAPQYAAGGGGGAGAVAGNGSGGTGGAGGAGSFIADAFIKTACAPSYGTPGPVSLTRYFSGGGGGSFFGVPAPGAGGVGGVGGGGAGASSSGCRNGIAGTINTGGGGGGGATFPGTGGVGGSGGSGIVIIRYKFQ